MRARWAHVAKRRAGARPKEDTLGCGLQDDHTRMRSAQKGSRIPCPNGFASCPVNPATETAVTLFPAKSQFIHRKFRILFSTNFVILRDAAVRETRSPLFRYKWQVTDHSTVLMREARNPHGSTPLFRSALVVRLETCAHRARILQLENLARLRLQPTDGSPSGNVSEKHSPCATQRAIGGATRCPGGRRR